MSQDQLVAVPKLGYQPALDGVRAVAICLVLFHHIGEPGRIFNFMSNGSANIGVDIFFVLSGFLITRLMLDERAGTGRVSLKRFWIRRAFRLLPLVIAVIAVVLVLDAIWPQLFFRSGADVSPLRDGFAALTYHMNFLMMWPSTAHIWALTHTWSLSVEEQFYLLWPLMVVAAIRLGKRRPNLAVCVMSAAIVLISAACRVAFWSSQAHVYNGLDSRSGQLCAGAFLAGASLCWPALLRWLARGAWVALAIVAAFALRFGISYKWHGLGYDFVSLLAIVLICGGLHGGRALRLLLEHPVAVYLGKRSYAIYLVHYPLYLALTPARLSDLPSPAMVALRLALALLLAELAHRVVERPAATLKARVRYLHDGAGSPQRLLTAASAAEK